MTERPTVRPVTLARLVELTNVCKDNGRTTEEVESILDVSHRRARETILEAVRIGLLTEEELDTEDESSVYSTTPVGSSFLSAIRNESWLRASTILQQQSPHYGAFLDTVEVIEPADPERILCQLESDAEETGYDYNETSIDVVGDWGERLGAIQRNSFTGAYYRCKKAGIPVDFDEVLLSVFDDLEETAGLNLSQRYLSIPRLREHACEALGCTREDFNTALLSLVSQNVGRLELSGAPIDTGAKDAALGIKQIELSDEEGLVSTNQSTERVMSGVEQYGKHYYYLAVHDKNITYTPSTEQ